MKRIASFEKVSYKQFKEDVENYYYEKLNIMPEVFNVDIVDGPMKED